MNKYDPAVKVAAGSVLGGLIMKRIASITLSASEKRYWLELDDGQRIGLSPAVFLTSGYSCGDLIAQADWQQLAREEERARLRKAALTILDHSDRTEAELTKRLSGDPDLVNEVIIELRSMGVVDDQRYADQAVERHLRRGKEGKRKFRHQLQRLGLASELIAKAVEKIDDDAELAAAVVYAERQLRGFDLGDRAVVRRIYNGLLRRGFQHTIARSAIRILERNPDNREQDR